MFTLIVVLVLGVILWALAVQIYNADRNSETQHALVKKFKSILLLVPLVIVASASIIKVPTSNIGVIKTFGKVSSNYLGEGIHLTLPWQTVSNVSVGMDTSTVTEGQAASKDLQGVSASIVVNFYVDPTKAVDLYRLDPSLQYKDTFVTPATAEVFKAVVSQYTAEELVTKRQQVSESVLLNLNNRLKQYHIKIQTVNMVNFNFSKAFDVAIEEKVTASQKAETAKRDLERIKYEAESRVAAAEGEAKAIAIQAAAIDKQGGAAYVQLKAVEKWDGKLPAYMTSGAATPFVQLK